jgi:TonB family protein
MRQLKTLSSLFVIVCAMSPVQAQSNSSTGAEKPPASFQVADFPNIALSTSIGQSTSLYVGDMQRRIKRAWFPPKINQATKLTVSFTLHKDGKATDVRILKPSGVSIVDAAAIKAVENASPLRPLPSDAPDSVRVEFSFLGNAFTE